MTSEEFLNILSIASKLKTTMRHCETEEGRMESVADHSWRIALMAMLLSGETEFQKLDMNRVRKICLTAGWIHFPSRRNPNGALCWVK